MYKEALRTHFDGALALPPQAVTWLLDLWDAIQALDDWVDGDEVALADRHTAIWTILVSLPCNPFFLTHAASLHPALAGALLKWKASDDAERAGRADERSFAWRASYYDVVLLVVALCHGPAAALASAESVLALYGEKYKDYKKEFKKCPHL